MCLLILHSEYYNLEEIRDNFLVSVCIDRDIGDERRGTGAKENDNAKEKIANIKRR